MAEAKEDSIELSANGHVVLIIEGKKYDCRRPKSKEYFDLTEQAITLGSEITEKQAALLPDSTDAEVDIADIMAMARKPKEQIESIRTQLDLTGDWFINLLNTLSAVPFEGTKDDLPPWIIGEASTQIINHWISVPLVAPGR